MLELIFLAIGELLGDAVGQVFWWIFCWMGVAVIWSLTFGRVWIDPKGDVEKVLAGGTGVLFAFLLFLVQPMVGKMVTPLLGGTPAVWVTCMLFFQALLLAGYAYAHAAPARLGIRRQAVLHVGILLLPLLVLPVAVPSDTTALPGLTELAGSTPLVWPEMTLSAPLVEGPKTVPKEWSFMA